MKKTFLFIVLMSVLLNGCKPFEDDLISQQCIDNCTRITGELTTLGGQYPIRNVLARIRYTNNVNGSERIVREKAVTEVDENGLFDMQFEVRDDELERGNYFVRFYVNPEEYFFFGNRTFTNFDIYEDISSLVDQERHYKYIMPKRGKLRMEIENPEEMNQGDKITPTFKLLCDPSYEITVSSLILGISKESPLQQIDFAAGERIQIELYREKNGIVSREYDTITISVWQGELDYRIRF